MKGYKKSTVSLLGIKKRNTDSAQMGSGEMGRSLLGQGNGKAPRARGKTCLGNGGKWVCTGEKVGR